MAVPVLQRAIPEGVDENPGVQAFQDSRREFPAQGVLSEAGINQVGPGEDATASQRRLLEKLPRLPCFVMLQPVRALPMLHAGDDRPPESRVPPSTG